MVLTMPPDPYAALGLDRDVTLQAIKARYYMLARRYHPNRNQGNEDSQRGLAEHFGKVQSAWKLLGNGEHRRRYHEREALHALQKEIVRHLADAVDLEQNDSSCEDSSLSDTVDFDLPHTKDVHRHRRRSQSVTPACSHNNVVFDRVQRRSILERARSDSTSSTESSIRRTVSHKRMESADIARRQKLDKLRRKEVEAFHRYQNAMLIKLEAEEEAEARKEQFDMARWRRERFERTPRETSARMRTVQQLQKAIKAFTQLRPRRVRAPTTTYGQQFLSTGNPFDIEHVMAENLALQGRMGHRRGYSSDVSGDQTSTDEESSNKAVAKNMWQSLPHRRRRRRDFASGPQNDPPTLPMANSRHTPRSESYGAFQMIIKRPTDLNGSVGLDSGPERERSGSGSISSSSPASRPSMHNTCMSMVHVRRTSKIFGVSHRDSSPNGTDCAYSASSEASDSEPLRIDVDLHSFTIKMLRAPRHLAIPLENVQEVNGHEKDSLIGDESHSKAEAVALLDSLRHLDGAAEDYFMIKPDVKSNFRFRLIFSDSDLLKPKRSFIALSYRRRIPVEKTNEWFGLPLLPDMYQAVWDELISEHEGIWVDQICIDQDSDTEKTLSMSAMDMVYKSARLVVVALDDIELDVAQSNVLEQHMHEFEKMTHVTQSKRFRRHQPPYLESNEELYQVLQKILSSSWFRRAWCRHEMRLAKDHVFLLHCQSADSGSKSVLRFTGKCMAHLLALATEVPFDPSIELIKPALFAFFRDRARPASNGNTQTLGHHGNFTTVTAEVFAMGAGGDPTLPEAQREADARKDKLAIVLNTMECGLALQSRFRDPQYSLPISECFYILLLLALAARDPGALCSVGHPIHPSLFRSPPISTSWLLEPTNVDAGLNNYRTLNRLPISSHIGTGLGNARHAEHYVELDLKFLEVRKAASATASPDILKLSHDVVSACEERKFGRHRKRYLIGDATSNTLFGSMMDVYVETLACVFECGPSWMEEVCRRYGVSRWKQDFEVASWLLVSLRNMSGKWPTADWTERAAGFLMDFVNFLVIRGMPQRQIVHYEPWRPRWVATATRGKWLTFAPQMHSGSIRVAVPSALLDGDYVHLARLWVLESRQASDGSSTGVSPPGPEWTLLGKSVLFSDERAIQLLDAVDAGVSEQQRVFGRR